MNTKAVAHPLTANDVAMLTLRVAEQALRDVATWRGADVMSRLRPGLGGRASCDYPLACDVPELVQSI